MIQIIKLDKYFPLSVYASSTCCITICINKETHTDDRHSCHNQKKDVYTYFSKIKNIYTVMSEYRYSCHN